MSPSIPVSTTVRPVALTAEVEVKRALTNPTITVRAGDRVMDSEIRMEVFLALNLKKLF